MARSISTTTNRNPSAGAAARPKLLWKRRLRPWTDVGMAIESEITLSNQERSAELEYRVITVNKTDEDEVGNTVMVVL